MTEAPLLARIADELDRLRGSLDALGAALCGDASMADRFMPELQRLDELGQCHQYLADVLRAVDQEAAVRALPLEALASRLGHRRDPQPQNAQAGAVAVWG